MIIKIFFQALNACTKIFLQQIFKKFEFYIQNCMNHPLIQYNYYRVQYNFFKNQNFRTFKHLKIVQIVSKIVFNIYIMALYTLRNFQAISLHTKDLIDNQIFRF